VLDNADVLLGRRAGHAAAVRDLRRGRAEPGAAGRAGAQSAHGWLRWPATAFVEFFRNTPVLVQILWFYFALPILLPFEVSPLLAAALGISLNSAAFTGRDRARRHPVDRARPVGRRRVRWA
jgi:His/Glu/Gln/Arg/opine family amino acid ABC transporter permease subunit